MESNAVRFSIRRDSNALAVHPHPKPARLVLRILPDAEMLAVILTVRRSQQANHSNEMNSVFSGLYQNCRAVAGRICAPLTEGTQREATAEDTSVEGERYYVDQIKFPAQIVFSRSPVAIHLPHLQCSPGSLPNYAKRSRRRTCSRTGSLCAASTHTAQDGPNPA